MKLVLDQDDATELRPGDEVNLGRKYEHWKVKVNDARDVDPDVEATTDQLTVLDFKLRSGKNPFADFGVEEQPPPIVVDPDVHDHEEAPGWELETHEGSGPPELEFVEGVGQGRRTTRTSVGS